MTDISHTADTATQRSRQTELWEFRVLVAATYPLFLASELARRATGRKPAGTRSVFTEAYGTASATLACAFMG